MPVPQQLSSGMDRIGDPSASAPRANGPRVVESRLGSALASSTESRLRLGAARTGARRSPPPFDLLCLGGSRNLFACDGVSANHYRILVKRGEESLLRTVRLPLRRDRRGWDEHAQVVIDVV